MRLRFLREKTAERLAEMMKKIGIIDVGSNSHRLLAVALEGESITELARGKITTRMLSGLKDGAFTREAIDKNIAAIAQLKAQAAAVGCDRFMAFATSAMRDAENRQQVIDEAAAIGVEMRVLSGDEEAEMAYAGVGADGRIGIVDIGGGSTEILTGADGKVLGGGSAQMGAVRLTAKCPEGTPRERLIAEARQVLQPVFERADQVQVDRWVGVGGTATTLAAMDLQLTAYDAEKIQDHPITCGFVSRRLDEMLAMTLEQRRHIPGLQPERADIICAGAAIMMAFFELSGAETVYASDSDNLMGYLRSHAESL